MASFEDYCTPAQLYLVLLVIAVIGMFVEKYPFTSILLKGVFGLIWAYLLNLLCEKGFTAISWLLVLLPFIMVMMVVIMAVQAANSAAHRASVQNGGLKPLTAGDAAGGHVPASASAPAAAQQQPPAQPPHQHHQQQQQGMQGLMASNEGFGFEPFTEAESFGALAESLEVQQAGNMH